MYRIECLIDDQWKPMSDQGLIVYFTEQLEAHGFADHLEGMCNDNAIDKSFRVINHIF